MLITPMGKKRRSRQRQRFTPRPAPVSEAREQPAVSREPARPRFTRPGTIGRAIGQPSTALLKAATLEVGFVTKDLRRIGIVAGACVALLVVADLIVHALLK